ncbi:hypothetical protein Tco_0245942 [Tanacetum coccineum]
MIKFTMAPIVENIIAAGSETRPLMLEKGMYDSWKTQVMLYIRGKENREMLRDSIENGPYKFNEIKAVNILFLGLPVVSTLSSTTIKLQRKFTFEPGELIHSYSLRFTKLINDMKMIPMTMSPMQVNMKFVNHLQPEWSRFVIAAKQAKDLHSSPPLQSYAPTVVQQPPTFQPDTGLAIPTFLPTDDPIASLNKSQGYAGNAGNNQASGAWVINAVGNAGANQPRFKDKMLLIQAQEAGVVLDEEQQDFLADNLEETNDGEDLQLQATSNFKAVNVDAYDSDCDDEATSNAIFMANLSPIGSLNDDTVATRYDSDTIFEVPHYDTYHDSDMLNSYIKELGYIENIISNNESYDELKGNSDVISYTDYMLTIGNDKDNYVPPPVQMNDMMLSVFEQMKSQVEKCNKRRTMLSPHEIGSWEQSDIKEVKEMKDIFEQMEDEVDQCSVAKKSFEIEKKQLLINNDRLLEENITSDIMCTYLRSLNEVDNYEKSKSLDIMLLDLQE